MEGNDLNYCGHFLENKISKRKEAGIGMEFRKNVRFEDSTTVTMTIIILPEENHQRCNILSTYW
jgi:hypothetical protein